MQRWGYFFIFFMGLFLFTNGRGHCNLVPENFKYHSNIKGHFTANQGYMVHLTDHIFEHCQENCKDLRFFDTKGTEISFVIVKHVYPEQKSKHYNMDIMAYDSDNKTTSIVLKTKNTHIDKIFIKTPNVNFNKTATLYGSPDLHNWQMITNEILYDYTRHVDLRNTAIKLDKSLAFPYYKIIISKDTSKFKTKDSIHLKYGELYFSFENSPHKTRDFKIEAVTSTLLKNNHTQPTIYDKKNIQFKLKHLDKKTEIFFESHLPFETINFKINPPPQYFNRKVNLYYKNNYYRYKNDGYALLKTSSIHNLPVHTNKRPKTYIKITANPIYKNIKATIYNQNSLTLNIASVELKWPRHYAIFIPPVSSANITLCVGSEDAKAPVYDLQDFINQNNWFSFNAKKAASGPVYLNKDYNPVKTDEYYKGKLEMYLLLSVVLIAVILMSYWLYKLVRSSQSK